MASKQKIMTIFGTRPEVIKLAPIIFELERSPHFESVLVTTGQHREMLGQALEQFHLEPAYNLDIMEPSQAVTDVTVDSLKGVEELIALEKPSLVLVQGDTTTAFAGCLAAFYEKTAVGHVEAGLRTYDKYRPFPEEINRSLITHLADIHFVPTYTAWESLRHEGIMDSKIFITGNTVIDSLYHVVDPHYVFANPILKNLKTEGRRLVVVTSHRRESFGQPILDICHGISTLVDRFADIEVVFSVHRNPKVRVPVTETLGHHERIHLVEPLGYGDMANLLSRSYLVLTDSGGLQEEAPALAKPVLVLRDVTERPEAVQAGLARVIGTATPDIVAAASDLLQNQSSYVAMAKGLSPYGDGQAATRILQAIEFFCQLRPERPQPFVSLLGQVVTGDFVAAVEKPLSDELFYQQLEERIEKAKLERRQVSVATFDLAQSNDEQFNKAVRSVARSLRSTDTAATLNGKRLVLVLPGASEAQANTAAKRIKDQLSGLSLGLGPGFDVDIRTYAKEDEDQLQGELGVA